MGILLSVVSVSFAKTVNHSGLSHGSVIMVKASSPVVKVTLRENPSTGYRWYLLKYDANVVAPIGNHYQAAKTKRMGAPGHSIWEFKFKPAAFVVRQITRVIMTHAQSWQLNQAAPFVLTFITVPAKNSALTLSKAKIPSYEITLPPKMS